MPIDACPQAVNADFGRRTAPVALIQVTAVSDWLFAVDEEEDMQAIRRPIALLLLLWFLPACSTYRTTDLTPQQAVAGQHAVRVKLTDAEGTEFTVEDPWVRADTLGGVQCGWDPIEERKDCDEPAAVPLSSVREIRTKQFNVLLTSGVVLGSFVALAGGLVIVCFATSDCVE